MNPYRRAMVVGAGSGIGRAVAAALAGDGLELVLVGRRRAELEATRAALDAQACTRVCPCDLTDRAASTALAQAVREESGPVDVLVYSAGLNVADRSLRALSGEDWDRVLAANLTGAYHAAQAVLPGMRDQGRGLVVLIGSISGARPSVISGAAYSASKAALRALGISISREERGRGIRASVLMPGEVNTALLESRPGRPGAPADTRRREGILEPEDIAAAVRFLIALPLRAHVPEMIIKPAIDDFA